MIIIKMIKVFSHTNLVELINMIIRRRIQKFRVKSGIYNTDYSLEKTWCQFQSDSEQCEVNIHGLGFVSVIESPHYIHISEFAENHENKSSVYKDYLKKYYPNEDIEKTIARYENLFEKMQTEGIEKELLVELPCKISGKIRIVDGTHRLAILTSLGIKSIKFAGKI